MVWSGGRIHTYMYTYIHAYTYVYIHTNIWKIDKFLCFFFLNLPWLYISWTGAACPISWQGSFSQFLRASVRKKKLFHTYVYIHTYTPHIMTGIIFAVFASVCQKKNIFFSPYRIGDHFGSFCERLSEKKTICFLKYRIGDHRGRVFKHLFEKKKFKDP